MDGPSAEWLGHQAEEAAWAGFQAALLARRTQESGWTVVKGSSKGDRNRKRKATASVKENKRTEVMLTDMSVEEVVVESDCEDVYEVPPVDNEAAVCSFLLLLLLVVSQLFSSFSYRRGRCHRQKLNGNAARFFPLIPWFLFVF